MYHEHKKVHKKNILLQSKLETFSTDFSVLQNKKDALLIMNSDFKRQLDSLKDVFNSLILNENLVKKKWNLESSIY